MSRNLRWVYGICVTASLIMVAVVLYLWAATEVRAEPAEIYFLTSMGVVWLILATLVFPWLGLSLRDDVVERKNVAALIALCGAIMAVATIYAGGSIGEGPSYWNNFFSAGLATAGFLVLWTVFELGAKVSISIAEERDPASGLRTGGFLLATGLMLGRAVAGDWHSEAATLHDFIRDGWPAGILCAMALLVERFARPCRRRPFPPWPAFGLLPALVYLAGGAAWLWHLGAWEGMPK